MKLHDLKPAPGSTHRRIRVGRGIAAGKGKTAGRGTKGQKSRAGASIPAWFEGGQTPIHVRVPKLRGFKPIGRIEYQVVNIGRISAYAEAGRLGEPLTARSPVHREPRDPARRRAHHQGARAGQDPGQRRGLGAHVRARRRVHEQRPGQDRGRRRHAPEPDAREAGPTAEPAATATAADAPADASTPPTGDPTAADGGSRGRGDPGLTHGVRRPRQRLSRAGHPAPHPLRPGDAGRRPWARPRAGAGRRQGRARRRSSRPTRSCSCWTCSPAAASPRSRSSRWASTRTSTPRSSCSS